MDSSTKDLSETSPPGEQGIWKRHGSMLIALAALLGFLALLALNMN